MRFMSYYTWKGGIGLSGGIRIGTGRRGGNEKVCAMMVSRASPPPLSRKANAKG